MKNLNFFKINRKIIFINSVIFLFLLVSPSILLAIYRSSRNVIMRVNGFSVDPRAKAKQFKDKIFSNKIFSELDSLDMQYKSFIGWRPKVVKMKYTNIETPYNNRYSNGQSLFNSTWFFGGSTIWGFGSSDEGTIPSIYSKKKKSPVFNFGEQSWVSRQSLNQYLSVLGDGYKPKLVIFYGGINDVSYGCRLENKNGPNHSRQEQISSYILDNKRIINYTKIFDLVLEPYLKISQKIFKSKPLNKIAFDCTRNLKKANNVASHLVNNWYSAYLISRANNAPFIAVLQPYINPYGSNYKNLLNNSYLEEIKQYETVYLLIKKKIKEKCISDKVFCSSFFDGSNWIDANSNFFIDTNHLIEEGNKVIAEKLKNLVEEKYKL